MLRIERRKAEAERHTGKFTIKGVEALGKEQLKIMHCTIIPGSNGWFEVVEKGSACTVNMRRRTCTCRKWDTISLIFYYYFIILIHVI